MTNRTPENYNWEKLEFNDMLLPDNLYNKGRAGNRIEYFTIHHMIILDNETKNESPLVACRNVWINGRQASAHYGVSGDFVGQYVWDDDTAWSNGNLESNRRSLAVEHANKTLDLPGTENDYLVDEKTFFTGARLIANGHHRFNLKPRKNVTVRRHGEFSSTACPGPYMNRNYNRYFDLMHDIYNTIKVGGAVAPVPSTPVMGSSLPARSSLEDVAKEVINGVWGNGTARFNALKSRGYDPKTVQDKVNEILNGVPTKTLDTVAREVILGTWGNDPKRSQRLRAAGYNPVEVQARVNALLR